PDRDKRKPEGGTSARAVAAPGEDPCAKREDRCAEHPGDSRCATAIPSHGTDRHATANRGNDERSDLTSDVGQPMAAGHTSGQGWHLNDVRSSRGRTPGHRVRLTHLCLFVPEMPLHVGTEAVAECGSGTPIKDRRRAFG